jgi:hypothetical protein
MAILDVIATPSTLILSPLFTTIGTLIVVRIGGRKVTSGLAWGASRPRARNTAPYSVPPGNVLHLTHYNNFLKRHASIFRTIVSGSIRCKRLVGSFRYTCGNALR